MSELELRKGPGVKPALVGGGIGVVLTTALFVLGPFITFLVLVVLGAGALWRVFSE